MKLKTLLIKEPSGQLMVTPEVFKAYSNKDYAVYKSTFEGHPHIILRKRDKAVAFSENYMGTNEFIYKLEGSF